MFEKVKTQATDANKALLEANARADALLDPRAAKIVASRYTTIYVILASILFFSVGFTLGQYF